jgi:hypothetical protein
MVRAFEEAEEGLPVSEEDRAALTEAEADPRWIRLERGQAFERLVCENEDEKKNNDESE